MCSFGHKERYAEGHPVLGTMRDSGDTVMKQVDMFSALIRLQGAEQVPRCCCSMSDLDVEDHGDILDVGSRVFSI